METEYSSYLERDEKLYELVAPVLPGLKALSIEQVETFIFYLKSLHSYYPSSANDLEYFQRFGKRLTVIRESKEQKALQRPAAGFLFKAMATCVVSGALIAAGAIASAGGMRWGIALIAASIVLFMLAETRFGIAALKAAKEQDRRYFLECIRSARSCSELDWAGLFSYNGVAQGVAQNGDAGESTRQRVAELTAQLRSALYNDEHMDYSSFVRQADGP